MHLMLKRNTWLWMIPVLLLAVLLAGRRINSLSFTHDETWTLTYVGARSLGPKTVMQAIRSEQHISGDQAFGWTILINRWGAVAGWSTVSMRAWSFFFGLLALAIVWRAGNNMFGFQTGLGASLLLLASSLAIQYFHIGRAFTTVLFFSALMLSSYWRTVLAGRPASRSSQAGLLFGGVGLLYSHYFAALMFPALGLFHLLFVRKDRRWWATSLTLLLIFLAALPQLTVLYIGVENNVSRYAARGIAMDVAETLNRLIYALTNGALHLPRQFNPGLLLLLPLSMLALYKTRSRSRERPRAAWYLGVTALVFLCLVLAVNHFVPVLISNRMRYLLAAWPPVVWLISAGISHLGKRQRRVADWLLAGMVASGVAIIMGTPYYRPYDNHEESVIHLAD